MASKQPESQLDAEFDNLKFSDEQISSKQQRKANLAREQADVCKRNLSIDVAKMMQQIDEENEVKALLEMEENGKKYLQEIEMFNTRNIIENAEELPEKEAQSS